MPARFFIEGVREPGDLVTFDAGDARKMVTVLRLRDGDEIEAIDSASRRFRAVIERDIENVRARLCDVLAERPKGSLRVTVAQGIPKGQKMDYVVEKLTELGAIAIIPLRSERVIADASPAKLDRWRRLAKTAAMQCGRSDVPTVDEPFTVAQLAELVARTPLTLVPWEAADPVPLRTVLPDLIAGAREILVVIGPEGGFAPGEVAKLESAGAKPVSLGSRILRTETAGLVLLAMLEYASDALTE